MGLVGRPPGEASIRPPRTAGIVKGFRMPASHCARGCTEAGVRKASKEETAGEYAPAAVSVYGDFRRGSARLGRSRTDLLAGMGSGVGDFGWRACRGPRGGVLKDLGFGGRG